MNASTRLSMNGKSPMISTGPPFVLRFSKDERRAFQQNQLLGLFRRWGSAREKSFAGGAKNCANYRTGQSSLLSELFTGFCR